IDGVSGHREALRGLSYTASVMLNSTVCLAEIERANVVVHASAVEVNSSDLRLVEDDVMNVLELGYDEDGVDKPVRAVLMDGLGTDHYPGGYPLSVTVYAGHDLALDAHERMASPEYKHAVNGGGR
ncbi:hypothetical protein QA599_19575, partial [Haloarculaceae archaeon H-GB1-1]|nr:hypothetical protein [Haloarculaceae archaeon H-GB1-1]